MDCDCVGVHGDTTVHIRIRIGIRRRLEDLCIRVGLSFDFLIHRRVNCESRDCEWNGVGGEEN